MFQLLNRYKIVNYDDNDYFSIIFLAYRPSLVERYYNLYLHLVILRYKICKQSRSRSHRDVFLSAKEGSV